MKKHITRTTHRLPKFIGATILGSVLVLSGTERAEAQRPSLGNLQNQLNDCKEILDALLGLGGAPPQPQLFLGEGVIFGPGPCGVGIDPMGFPPGLQLRDVECVRLFNPNDPGLPPLLYFGETNDCGVGIDPNFPGLQLRDPRCVRLLNPFDPFAPPPILYFGPNDDCGVGFNPEFPGLQLRDVECIRLLNPRDPFGPPPILYFGPTNDCGIGVLPNLPGLTETDPNGFRLLGPGGQGCRLIFGPGVPEDPFACSIEVLPPQIPPGPAGLLLRDPKGIRIWPRPIPDQSDAPPRLLFGPTDDCTIGIDPRFRGLSETDPNGFRLLGQNLQGCELLFGPTDLCRIYIDPELLGMFLEDPEGFTFQAPGGLQTQVAVNGFVIADEFVNRSSRDLKENIQPLDNALDTVKKLRGVSFDWKKEQGGKSTVGFIADEVAEVVPELTAFDEEGKATGVQYANMVALVVEGVKAQQEQIEELKAENEKLKDDLNALKEAKDQELRDELDALRAQMAELAKRVN